MIIIIDFGSQSTHLISRRLREMGITTRIITPDEALHGITQQPIAGIILSGGPASVYESDAPPFEKKLLELSVPVLGICYGEQLIAHHLDGEVKPGKKKEYGPATVTITDHSGLFHSTDKDPIPDSFSVWMSHGDEVTQAPTGFITTAHTETIPHAAIENRDRNIYAIQFHPEVVHTQFGEQILKNFIRICGLIPVHQPLNKDFVDNLVADIKESLGSAKAICALSGGVDSSVAAVLVHEAIGDQLISIYIDSGLMRKDETKILQQVFDRHYRMQVKVIHAQDQFLQNLRGITDPEEKRKVIGKTFIDVLDAEAKKLGIRFLVQGTIYPDVIESAGTKHSKNIKSHHNVGGLPPEMNLSLVEPLRQFYKDEVRQIGSLIGLPDEIVKRPPFPGPGLAVRIIGEVTESKLAILREADSIVQEEIKKSGLEQTLWQCFAIFTGIKTTGVRGDNRAYGETIAIRAIEAKDAMSAHWAHLPYELLDRMSVRIVTEITAVNRVVFDITNKPPATMEWE